METLPLYAIVIRSGMLAVSIGLFIIAMAIAIRAWLHSGSLAIGAIALLFAGLALRESYLTYWYAFGELRYSLDFFIMPNLGSLIMNVGTVLWLIALFHKGHIVRPRPAKKVT